MLTPSLVSFALSIQLDRIGINACNFGKMAILLHETFENISTKLLNNQDQNCDSRLILDLYLQRENLLKDHHY